MKKDHEYRKSAETASHGRKTSKRYEEIMDGFTKNRKYAKGQVPLTLQPGNKRCIDQSRMEYRYARTTLHIECNGCGGHHNKTILEGGKTTNEDKEWYNDRQSDLESKVAKYIM